ncbi:acyl-CoA N-acyltransferase [Alternaria rosae]|uniref:acyl-CoA N-acyltransferase n=1 Tax=Alternaria rosae TaxID=1187941 RepID=UPI001E8E4C4F|nr:acyl-CoA N-acyltransferase [Alternaria rosae]KAH6865665.1 acyl-CoA N-acyltransferase [Alternaria rosae]
MPPSYTISNALPSDASAISSLFALSWQSPFSRLQFGNVEPHDLDKAMTPKIAQQIEEGRMVFIVAREEGSGDVVSVAQWSVPPSLSIEEKVQEKEEREEREAFDEEVYLNSLPPTCNHALIFEFTTRLRVLRERTLQGAPHFLLDNLATHPEHRGQGLAARLIRHALDMADERGVVVYLETGEENKVRGLYERLGFEEKGRERIELKRFASREERERLEVGDMHVVIGYVRLLSKTT